MSCVTSARRAESDIVSVNRTFFSRKGYAGRCQCFTAQVGRAPNEPFPPNHTWFHIKSDRSRLHDLTEPIKHCEKRNVTEAVVFECSLSSSEPTTQSDCTFCDRLGFGAHCKPANATSTVTLQFGRCFIYSIVAQRQLRPEK